MKSRNARHEDGTRSPIINRRSYDQPTKQNKTKPSATRPFHYTPQLPGCLPAYLYIYLSACLPPPSAVNARTANKTKQTTQQVAVSLCLSGCCLSICLSISIYLSIYLPICLLAAPFCSEREPPTKRNKQPGKSRRHPPAPARQEPLPSTASAFSSPLRLPPPSAPAGSCRDSAAPRAR